MDYEILHDRVFMRLERLVEERFGVGSKPQIQDSLGVGSTFFSDLRRHKARLPMDKIAQLLEMLGEHPAMFFYEALRDGDLPPLPGSNQKQRLVAPKILDAELEEEVAQLLRTVEARMGEVGSA